MRAVGIAAAMMLVSVVGARHVAMAQAPTSSAQPRLVASATRIYARPADSVLRTTLTPLQYAVTQHAYTEYPFLNEYWNNHAAGIYVDIVSGQPVFSSTDKYDPKTGWPSFTRPIDSSSVYTDLDSNGDTEVRSAGAKSHLGHVFHDGPPPIGLRYCINSAALRFVPVDSLAAEGYGKYLSLFGRR